MHACPLAGHATASPTSTTRFVRMRACPLGVRACAHAVLHHACRRKDKSFAPRLVISKDFYVEFLWEICRQASIAMAMSHMNSVVAKDGDVLV